jgi:hypothetical protein
VADRLPPAAHALALNPAEGGVLEAGAGDAPHTADVFECDDGADAPRVEADAAQGLEARLQVGVGLLSNAAFIAVTTAPNTCRGSRTGRLKNYRLFARTKTQSQTGVDQRRPERGWPRVSARTRRREHRLW